MTLDVIHRYCPLTRLLQWSTMGSFDPFASHVDLNQRIIVRILLCFVVVGVYVPTVRSMSPMACADVPFPSIILILARLILFARFSETAFPSMLRKVKSQEANVVSFVWKHMISAVLGLHRVVLLLDDAC
mmetsp:Transcript_11806/g.21488  ORF Transcript_11806/g.21488 Transcript_11806/m.21488 type:complete len:130 (+) Transcript_11806:175-564(+)